MKALPKKLLSLTLFGIAVTSLVSVRPAQAYTVTLDQVGSNVVATGNGAINLTGLTILSGVGAIPVIEADKGDIFTGPTAFALLDAYGGFSGPASFGSGGPFFPNTGSGNLVGMAASTGGLFVPQGYVSDTALSDSMTFNNQTFASMRLTPGTYVWTWGTGLPNQNFTLIIPGAGVPDGGSTVSLLGCASAKIELVKPLLKLFLWAATLGVPCRRAAAEQKRRVLPMG